MRPNKSLIPTFMYIAFAVLIVLSLVPTTFYFTLIYLSLVPTFLQNEDQNSNQEPMRVLRFLILPCSSAMRCACSAS